MTYAQQKRGYSLVEMIVAIGLFSVVMLLATAAFVKFMALDRVARYSTDVTNNLNFAVDSMARSIRTGKAYRCGPWTETVPNCWPGGESNFTFEDDEGRVVTYRTMANGSLGRCAFPKGEEVACTDSNAVGLTDKRITVERMMFYVRGVGEESAGNGTQPQVVISMRGTMLPDPDLDPVEFTIQTMATQRVLDL